MQSIHPEICFLLNLSEREQVYPMPDFLFHTWDNLRMSDLSMSYSWELLQFKSDDKFLSYSISYSNEVYLFFFFFWCAEYIWTHHLFWEQFYRSTYYSKSVYSRLLLRVCESLKFKIEDKRVKRRSKEKTHYIYGLLQ